MLEPLVFYTLGGLTVGASITVITARGPMTSVLSMIAALLAIAFLYMTLGAPMIGMLQIVVYAGAIMVLFLFVVMLFDLRATPRPFEGAVIPWPVVVLVTLVLLGAVAAASVRGGAPETSEVALTDYGTVEAVSEALLTRYLLPVEIASVLLLVAVVGVIFLAKREDR